MKLKDLLNESQKISYKTPKGFEYTLQINAKPEYAAEAFKLVKEKVEEPSFNTLIKELDKECEGKINGTVREFVNTASQNIQNRLTDMIKKRFGSGSVYVQVQDLDIPAEPDKKSSGGETSLSFGPSESHYYLELILSKPIDDDKAAEDEIEAEDELDSLIRAILQRYDDYDYAERMHDRDEMKEYKADFKMDGKELVAKVNAAIKAGKFKSIDKSNKVRIEHPGI